MSIKQILLVEDNVAICESMTELLQFEGYHVIAAHNGQLAMDYLNSADAKIPDVILLDLMMPVMNGIQFLESKKSDPKFVAIPVFIMTANGIPAEIEMFSVFGFFKKPIDIDQLFHILRNME